MVRLPRGLPNRSTTIASADGRVRIDPVPAERRTLRGRRRGISVDPSGGVHHLCYEVEDIIAARDKLKAEGARVLGDGEPRIGAHGKPVLFLHPKDFFGTLIELEQA